MKIIIEYSNNRQDVEVGVLDNFSFLRKENYYLITLDKCAFSINHNITKGEFINFRYEDSLTYLTSLILYEDLKLDEVASKLEYPSFEIKADLESYLSPYKLRFFLDLSNSWHQNQEKYKWQKISRLRKKVWLEASLQMHGISSYILNENKEIEIDTQMIHCAEDFYCYLGEALFGYSKYVGRGVSSFKDSLGFATNRKEYTFIFKDLDTLHKVLSKELLLDIFKSLDISRIKYIIK